MKLCSVHESRKADPLSFQEFPMLMQTHEARLAALRDELKRRELDGFVLFEVKL